MNKILTIKARNQMIQQDCSAKVAPIDSTIIIADDESTTQVRIWVADKEKISTTSPDTKHIFTKLFAIIIGSISSLLNWLNGSGSTDIDEQRMKTRCDQQLGLRKWNL